MFEERRKEVFVFIDGLGGQFDLLNDLLLIFRREVGHANIFCLVPALFDDVEFRRIGRQAFEMKPVWMLSQIFCFETFVTLKIVPDDDDFVFEIFVQLVEDVRHLGGLRTAGKRCRKESHVVTNRRDRNESDRRKMSPFFRLDDDGRLAERRPTSHKKGRQRKAGFVEKYDIPAVFTRLFLSAAIGAAAMFRPPRRNISSTA